MFFIASKIFWLLVQPLSLAILLGALGLVLSFTRLRRTSRAATAAGLIVFGLSAFTTLGQVMLGPLEAAFAPPHEPERIAGIIVLGGGMDAGINSVRGHYELNRAGDRFSEALRLALRHPAARIVISGGIGDLAQEGEPEAVAGARFFTAFGIDSERLVLETASRNTAENAANTRTMISPNPDETWVLITSAFHMPRAVGLFREAGVDVVPWPVDYRGTGEEGFGLRLSQPAENVATITLAAREWIGLLAYWATGRIEAPVPRP